MEKKQTESSKRNWKKAALNTLLGLAVIAIADQSGLLLRLADVPIGRAGAFAYHIEPDVQVRISPRICAFFSAVPTGVPMRAITLGRTIFVPRREVLPLSNAAIAHELRHVAQWKAHGLLGFSLSYGFWQAIRGYDGNPFEQPPGRAHR